MNKSSFFDIMCYNNYIRVENMNNKKNILIIIGIIAFIVILVGVSFSYFVYNKNLGDVSIDTGEISINYSDVNGNMSLTGIVPKSDNEGKISSDYIDFTVDGIVDTDKIYYELSIIPDSGNTIDSQYVKLYLTDQSDNIITSVSVYSSLPLNEKETGKRIYRETIDPNQNGTKKTYSKDFRLRVWLDESYSEQTTKTFEFNVNLYAKNVDNDYEIREGDRLIKKTIAAKVSSNSCTPTWTDPDDGVIYLSGDNNCIDFNYVWYSGKLWRITSIYPDGTMKLLTENSITSIAFNASGQVNFYTDANTTSYMYQWLNEDFYDTLYNANQFIDTTKSWNATMPSDTNVSTKPQETNIVTANVGLLNNYEYYNSYRCISSATCTGSSYSTGYLNIGYYWWLLNPYNTSNVWRVSYSGYDGHSNPANADGARPSIYLKSGLEFTGDGSKQSPYKIVGDKDTGAANELINTRISGEYVKLKNGNNEQLFRIIGVEDNKTKIIAMDYADNKSTKLFATSTGSANTLWGSGTTTDEGTWYTYLNTPTTGYYDTLKSTYGELFDSGLYYLGTSGFNYKLSVCANTTSGNTKICDKTSDKGTFNIGLPRYGEMFATQQSGWWSNSTEMWLINRYSTSNVWNVSSNGFGNYINPTYTYGARPTVHLKSSVKIISGKGTETDPYVVGL